MTQFFRCPTLRSTLRWDQFDDSVHVQVNRFGRFPKLDLVDLTGPFLDKIFLGAREARVRSPDWLGGLAIHVVAATRKRSRILCRSSTF